MLNGIAGLAAASTASNSVALAPPTAKAIVELDHRLSQAILAHDTAAAAALYDDDFLLTVAGGLFKRKADMLADIGNPAVKLTVCDTTDVTVRVRAGTAVLKGVLQQTGTVNGRPIDVKLHVTDTWVNVEGQWLLLAGHASFAK
jgi:ketosteroid isomerase-like protein